MSPKCAGCSKEQTSGEQTGWYFLIRPGHNSLLICSPPCLVDVALTELTRDPLVGLNPQQTAELLKLIRDVLRLQ